MKLNGADATIIQHLRKREQSWLLARWAALLIGLLMLCGSLFMFQQIWSTVAYDQLLLILCVWVAPASGIVLFIGATAILYVLAFWKGRPTNKLLLRLADEVAHQAK
jgi:ABC-type multidrug transport system permease subunit